MSALASQTRSIRDWVCFDNPESPMTPVEFDEWIKAVRPNPDSDEQVQTLARVIETEHRRQLCPIPELVVDIAAYVEKSTCTCGAILDDSAEFRMHVYRSALQALADLAVHGRDAE